jgi:DNA polymerase-1
VLAKRGQVWDATRSLGYVETVFGRRLRLPEIQSGSPARRQAAERAAINAPMQGTAADLIKLAMVSVDRALKHEGLQAAMILQIHDELVFEVAEADRERTMAVVREQMEGVYPLKVPLRVDVGYGHSWAEAH